MRVKRAFNIFIGCSFFLLLLAVALGVFEPPIANQVGRASSIIRLHDAKSGSFFCSGAIVGPHLAITAAHCVAEEMNTPFGSMGTMVRQNVQVRNWDESIKTNAKVAYANVQTDQAVLVGDFKEFSRRAIITEAAPDMAAIYGPNSEVISCGYPLGGPLYCVKISAMHAKDFWAAGHGQLFPGMSGGPLLDSHTGAVIGINYAVTEDWSLFTPTLNIFGRIK